MRLLTLRKRQLAILQAVHEYRMEHGYSPSVREIMKGAGISSTSVVAYNLNSLHRLGLLTREFATARTIVLTPDGMKEAEA